MITVTIYTTPTCPWCHKTKEFLNEKKIKYKEIDVSVNVKAQEKIIEISGQAGVPVIEIGNTTIVGYNPDEINKALKTNNASKHNQAKKKAY